MPLHAIYRFGYPLFLNQIGGRDRVARYGQSQLGIKTLAPTMMDAMFSTP
ncbi:hypothetical protein GGD56_003286 [Rhizobium mongolense]|uniref:Uncharacterized protein n=2 Tax=Rhizobium mongolense TaxID=57676 RepID=A0ABR6INQ2_9HYPH|nr:hypothetical protein [Rhizobium mongolense]TVZ73398.1 hypothetical protein BCL32_1621 [Rhizobium mongolense USDA 1844]